MIVLCRGTSGGCSVSTGVPIPVLKHFRAPGKLLLKGKKTHMNPHRSDAGTQGWGKRPAQDDTGDWLQTIRGQEG
jgi:hypothetical protein